jgi:two-component system, NarL family, sensor kinase
MTVRRPSFRGASSRVLTELRSRLVEAEETLSAIRSGGVDALVVTGNHGPRIYTLEGAEHSYRLLVESMNEGALILSADALILYANQRFARMLKRPQSRVMGQSLLQWLSEVDQAALTRLLKRGIRTVSTIQVVLCPAHGMSIPTQVSVRRMTGNGSNSAAFSVVVTDMTEARRDERALRRLSHSLLQAQEADRRRLAVELHDRTSQNLVALLMRIKTLRGNVPARAKALRREVAEIATQLGETAEVVEGISKQLRPSVLEILGLVPAFQSAIAVFEKRTDVPVNLACAGVPERLAAEAELVLYRILEQALKNVEEHARARSVTVLLRRRGAALVLVIRDDGVGFDTKEWSSRDPGREGAGLLGLRERAASVGGALKVASARGAGTVIEARIPLPPGS